MPPTPLANGPANSWTNLSPPSAPSPRAHPSIAYDSKTAEVILFGGWSPPYAHPLNDTWSYNPSTNRWTNRSPATHPEASCSVCYGTTAAVYDARADRVILYGANAPPQGMPNETWAYDPNGNTWTQMHPASNPGSAHDFGLVYDAAADRALRFGGGDIAPHYYDIGRNDTWSYDYANDTWTNLAPANAPSIRYGAGMAYDSDVDRTLLFGGCTNGLQLWPFCAIANDTWAYDYGTNTWTNRTPVASPPPGVGLPMVYDLAADHLIQFGEDAGSGNHTWSYNYTANVWATQNPSTSPPARAGPGMTYDAAAGRTILFGGLGSSYLNDTWAYLFGPPAPSIPSAPRNLRASMSLTYGGEYVNLYWLPPGDDGGHTVTEYRVYKGTASGGESFLAATTSRSYSDWFATQGATFFYEVTAVNVLGEGPRSNEVNSTPIVPGAPTNLRAVVGSTWNQVNLTWYFGGDGGSPLTGYRVYRGTAAGGETLLASAGMDWWYLDTGLQANTTYYYAVTAVNGVGEGARSNEVNATATPPPPPPDHEPPTVIISYPAWGAILNSTTVTVRGTSSDNVAVVRVEVSVDNGSWVVASGTTTWSLTVTLQEGGNTILVNAFDPSGNGGGSIVNFTVRTQAAARGGSGTGGTQSGPPVQWVAGGALVAAVAAAGAAVWWRMRRKQEPGPPNPP